MPVYQRNGHWWVDVQVGGRRIRKAVGEGATKRDAQDLEASLRNRLHEHRQAAHLGRAPRIPLNDAVEAWLTGEAKSLKSYRHIIDHARATLPYLNNLWLDQAQTAADNLKRAGQAEGLKPATLNQRLAIIRRVVNLSYERGLLNKPLKITLLPPNNARHIYLTIPQVHALADAAGAARDAILLLAYTGLRRGELLSLRAENKRGGCIVLGANNKAGKPRTIPLANPVKRIKVPLAITQNGLRRGFEQARGAIGMPELHLHDLRHTTASLLIQAGASLTEVRDILGHSSFAVTNRYAHLAPEHLRNAIARLNAVHSRYIKKGKKVSRGT